LERLHSDGPLEAGIYASAYRLLDASNIVGYLASSFLVAFIARNKNDKDAMEDAIFNTRHLLMISAVGMVSFVVMFAPWINKLLYHSDSHYNSLVIQLCMASFPGYCLVHVYGSVLTGSARFKQFITILVISVLFNTVFNVVLIPSKGALGCCLVALVTQYFCGIATLISSKKTLRISLNIKSIATYLLFGLVLILFFYFGKNALINVWIILGIAVFTGLLFLISQVTLFKKYFISLR